MRESAIEKVSPKVSIIMPLYNTYDYVSEAVLSVVHQTYLSWELIIIDDCSTDGSVTKACDLASLDARIRVISMVEKSGPAQARNLGIMEADGDFVAFLDSDDSWFSRKLEVQIAFMEAENIAFSYTDYCKIDEGSSVIGSAIVAPAKISYKELLKENKIGCLTVVYDVRRFGKAFMPLLEKRQDYGLWLKLLRDVQEAHKAGGVLAKYRVRSGSVSSSTLLNVKYNWLVFRKVERLSFLAAAYCLFWNMLNKLRR